MDVDQPHPCATLSIGETEGAKVSTRPARDAAAIPALAMASKEGRVYEEENKRVKNWE